MSYIKKLYKIWYSGTATASMTVIDSLIELISNQA